MHSKRGQITIFIIISILIIGTLTFFFIFREGPKKKLSDSPEAFAINSFVEDCLDQVLEEGVYEIARKGGYFSQPFATEDGITYYSFEDKDYFPSLQQVEQSISDYIDRKFFLCSRNFASFQDYKIERGNFVSKTSILEDKVLVEVNYPLAITNEDGVSRIKDFESEVSINMKEMYDVVAEFIIRDKSIPGVCISCLDEMPLPTNFHVEIAEDRNVVFFNFNTIDSNEKSFEWRFANKY